MGCLKILVGDIASVACLVLAHLFADQLVDDLRNTDPLTEALIRLNQLLESFLNTARDGGLT